MHLIEDFFDYQILHLTNQFYLDYPESLFPELIRKNNRPYNCLLIQSSYDFFICIPYRSHINHKYAYKFKLSARSKRMHSGLDYSKIVIITDSNYIGTTDVIIDQDEYNETRDNIQYIKNDADKYIKDYIDYLIGKSNKYDEVEFSRIYRFSTLKYFHRELGIPDVYNDRGTEIF